MPFLRLAFTSPQIPGAQIPGAHAPLKRIGLALIASLMMIGSGLAADARKPDLGALIEPSTLKAVLGQPNLALLDIRSGDTKVLGAKLFEAGHIPGAVHADYAFASWRLPREKVSVYLPEPAQFEALASDLGLSNDQHVVIIHDGKDASSFGAAARVYWTFKSMGHTALSILNGGHEAWVKAGLPLEQGSKTPSPGIFEARPNPALRASLDDVLAAKAVTLVDSRPPSFYSGLEKHRAVAAFGHIPGARSVPHSNAIGEDQRVKDKASLTAAYAEALGGEAVVSYCNTGHWAATNWFVLSEVLGKSNVTLYDGSMLEYAAENRGPVATAPLQAAKPTPKTN
jgi:thiosulfate/3-mercaptopyruvate sulfurtransferase